MTDPYTPVDEQATTAEPDLVSMGEVRSPVEQFAARLTDLGATADEVRVVVEHWDDLDPDDDTDPEAWTRARRDQLARASDTELTRLLKEARTEYELGTTTEDEAAAKAHTEALEAATAEAQGRIAGNVDSVLAWVADDDVRAEAVLRLELAPEGAGRKTLVGPLVEQLGLSEQEVEYLVATAYGQVGEATEVAGDTLVSPSWDVQLDTNPDTEADTLALPGDQLPDAAVGDHVVVTGPPDGQGNVVGTLAHVAEFDAIDGHPVLRWGPAPGSEAAEGSQLAEGTVGADGAAEAQDGAQGDQPGDAGDDPQGD